MERENTFLKIYRKILNWGWYGDTNTFRVFMHILLNANWEPGEYRGQKLNAGDCIFGRKKWAKELGLSERQVRTAIEHLKSTNEITIKSTNRFSVISVVKWDFWQVQKKKATTKTTNENANKRPTSDQQPTTHIEEENNKNKENNRYIAPTIEEIEAYISEKGLSVNGKKFFEYFEAGNWKDSKGNKVKNWKQKLLTWERYNAPERINNANQNKGNATADSGPKKYESNGMHIITEW